ncbi:MAG: hypothetical protein IPF55_08010 [Rhodoferax sp.]|nr:hypothetical protein [Rhodoferax sp.]
MRDGRSHHATDVLGDVNLHGAIGQLGNLLCVLCLAVNGGGAQGGSGLPGRCRRGRGGGVIVHEWPLGSSELAANGKQGGRRA